ncbi:MAG: DTW domain-containing protein [Bdellovibrionales bacterium]|nr:DTW domain-containing protein [Bdellovibrionales bacterium]
MSAATEAYRQRKAEMNRVAPARPLCLRCHKPQITCYCSVLQPIPSRPRIVVLMHPLEARHPVGTGRMAHQCLTNSELIIGINFTHHRRVRELLNDPQLYPMVLFPGPTSVNLTALNLDQRQALIPADREPVIIVLDGTWHLAKKMLHRSPNLQKIPRLCFTPDRLSEFTVRKQPHAQCFSTIEAIHELLSLFHGPGPAPHDVLIESFRSMVSRQLSFKGTGPTRHQISYARRMAKKLARKQQSENHRSP